METLEQLINAFIKKNPVIDTPLVKITIGKRINSGGTSIVHEAVLENVPSKFVIKLLLENIHHKETSAYKRFKQAYINISMNQSSGLFLPQIYFNNIQVSDEVLIPYTIMPFAEETLFTHCKDKSFDFNKWEKIFFELGKRIDLMHNSGIIHRDLKPQNLFIWNGSLLIGDCDIALYDKERYLKIVETKPSDRLGNYSFSSPEQADKNVDEITPAADWYAFGQIMYWLVYKTTIRGLQSIDLGFNHPEYNEVIRKLLNQKPDNRFQSFSEIKKYLDSYKEQHSRQIQQERFHTEAIQTTTLFDDIIFKYTAEYDAFVPCIQSITRREDINDIISFLQRNCEKMSLWISQGHSDIEVKNINMDIQNEVYSFYWHVMKIDKLAIFRLGNYPGGSLIIVFSSPQPSLQSLDETKYEDEEVCYYKNHIITRTEYDNGWAVIDGERVKTYQEEKKIEIRTLQKTIYFISPQFGLFSENMEIFEKLHNEYLEDNSISEDYFFEVLKQTKRSRIIRMYD